LTLEEKFEDTKGVIN